MQASGRQALASSMIYAARATSQYNTQGVQVTRNSGCLRGKASEISGVVLNELVYKKITLSSSLRAAKRKTTWDATRFRKESLPESFMTDPWHSNDRPRSAPQVKQVVPEQENREVLGDSRSILQTRAAFHENCPTVLNTESSATRICVARSNKARF